MEEQLAKMHRGIVRLKWQTGRLAALVVAAGLVAFQLRNVLNGDGGRGRFGQGKRVAGIGFQEMGSRNL